MQGPDTFLLGAPKCGTTAMARYLETHPQIFMCPIKEPNFFNQDYSPRSKMSLKNYLALFHKADPSRHRVVMEASVVYLVSREAVPGILRFNPAARFIVMLRDPLDLVSSWHTQLLSTATENIQDLEEAWRAQDDRRQGRRIPFFCYEPKILLYSEIARLGEQMERLLDQVPRERVHVVFYDDFSADPKAAYEGILSFLGIDSDARTDFPRVNEASTVHSPRLHLLFALARRLQTLLQKSGLLKRNLRGQLLYLKSLSSKTAPKPALSGAFRKELADYFRPDVAKLSALLGKDLSHWLKA